MKSPCIYCEIEVGIFFFSLSCYFYLFCYFLYSRYFLGDIPTVLENRREK